MRRASAGQQHGPQRLRLRVPGHLGLRDGGEAVGAQFEDLGKDVRAQAVTAAQCPVDEDLLAAEAGLLDRLAAGDPGGQLAALEERQNALHGPSAAIAEDVSGQVIAALNALMVDSMNIAEPSGCEQAPRLFTALATCFTASRAIHAAVEDVLQAACRGGQA